MIRLLIKLVVVVVLVAVAGVGYVYWMYQDQLKATAEKASEIAKLKQEAGAGNLVDSALTDAARKLKKLQDRFSELAAKLKEANQTISEYQALEFNGTRVKSPAEARRILKKLEQGAPRK